MSRSFGLIVAAHLLLGVACVRVDSSDSSVTDYDIVQRVIEDSSLHLQVGEPGPKRAVLYVDATCPNSMYALEQLLADTIARSRVVLQYYPQTLRDPIAQFETVALECARRSGSLQAYVTQRLDDAARGGRSVELSAASVGIDNQSFMACVANDTIDTLVSRQARLAIAAGIQLLPALVHDRRTIVGRDTVVSSFVVLR